MKELLINLQSSLRFIDLIDVTIVAFIVYRVLLLIKGTRAMQMLTGLGILAIGFLIASAGELFTTYWLLSHFFDYLVLIVVVLFQDDLRRALTHVGKNPFFVTTTGEFDRAMIQEVARAVTRLAQERVGALIVIERETGLKNFIETGSKLDSQVKAELIYSIFQPTSPIHDGAVIVTGGRIAAAGCFLPLSKDPNIDKKYGTRHRAALGITEDSDAIVVLVSEEAGETHLVKNGKLITNLSESELVQSLTALLDLNTADESIPRRMRGWLSSTRDKQKERS